MRCEEIREEMVAYLDGELDAEAREIVDSHLANCPDCRGELVTFESTDDLLQSLGGPMIPQRDLAAAVLTEAKLDPWCRHIRRELVAWVDGELSEVEARPVKEHLDECDECRMERDAHRQAAAALAEWTFPPIETDLVPRVMPLAAPRRPAALLRRLVPALAAACVLAVATIGVIIGTGDDDPAPLDGNGTLAIYEEKAVEAGVGPDLADKDLLELAKDLEMVESLPELDVIAMYTGNGG